MLQICLPEPIYVPERRQKLILMFGVLPKYSLTFKNEYLNNSIESSNFHLSKVKKFIDLLRDLYKLSISLYHNLYRFVINCLFIFKDKNSYIQLRYNDKIIFQKSVGMYGFKKKEKMSKYSKRILAKRFVKFFSKLLFGRGDRIHIILKGFRSSYKMSLGYLISNLKTRLGYRYNKYVNYIKLMMKKAFIIKHCIKNGLKYMQTNQQRVAERHAIYEKMKGQLYSFLYIKAFYLESSVIGGIRLRYKSKLSNKYY